MFRLLLFTESGQWFSTIEIFGSFGFTVENLKKVRRAINSSIEYWDAPITWELYFNERNVKDLYLEHVKFIK